MAEDEKDKFTGSEFPTERDEEIAPSPSNSSAAGGHGHRHTAQVLYGVMAEFDNPTDLVESARLAYDAGYRRINGYSPYPIEELSEAIGFTRTSLPLIVLIGGILG